MTTAIELPVGDVTWPLRVDPAKLVAVRRSTVSRPGGSPAELVRDALERPFQFEPLRRAVTPDDRVTVVLDPKLPHLGELVTGVLEHLSSAGIPAENVALLTPPGPAADDWLEELPDEFADVRTETHDPADRKRLAYLASTKAGTRVYLNRTLVEADFVILLTGRRYDPVFGYGGAAAAVFPAFSDVECRDKLAAPAVAPPVGGSPAATEAEEIVWLFGNPFLVQVIEGANGTVQDIVAGLPTSGAEGRRRQDARWRGTAAGLADTVIAAVSGAATFADVAAAAATAAQVVEPDGRVVVLAPNFPATGDAIDLIRRSDDPTEALDANAGKDAAVLRWATAARRARLFVAGVESDDIAEELFATAVRTPAEAQRLADAAGHLLVIPDAHLSLIETE